MFIYGGAYSKLLLSGCILESLEMIILDNRRDPFLSQLKKESSWDITTDPQGLLCS